MPAVSAPRSCASATINLPGLAEARPASGARGPRGHSLFDEVVELLPHRPLGLVKQDLRPRENKALTDLPLRDPRGQALSPHQVRTRGRPCSPAWAPAGHPHRAASQRPEESVWPPGLGWHPEATAVTTCPLPFLVLEQTRSQSCPSWLLLQPQPTWPTPGDSQRLLALGGHPEDDQPCSRKGQAQAQLLRDLA